MRPEVRRPLISLLGLLIGYLIYSWATGLPAPWQNVVIGLEFALIGLAAYFFGRSVEERWIQILGSLILFWAILRAFLPQG